jgi:hypothetical protein
MRVGILFSGAAMRGPARVTNAEGAVERILAQDFFKIGELARRTPQLERRRTRAADSNSSRVIPAILKAPESLDDDRDHFFGTNISNDAAHGLILSDGQN